MTTRAPRSGEREGINHYFVTPEEFERAFAAGELLERSGEYGKQYGVPRRSVREALATGNDVVIRVDIQGAESLRELLPDALFICLIPERLSDLEARIDERGWTDGEDRARRLAMAAEEIERATRFCVMVINREGRLDDTVEEIVRVMASERSRVDAERARAELDQALRFNPPPAQPLGSGLPIPSPATSEQEAERIAESTRAGRSTPLVRDAVLIQVALSAISEARNALVEFEGRGIEKALVEEFVLPELAWLEDALNLKSTVIDELLEARSHVVGAHALLSKATRAFEKAGEWAVAGVIGNAAYWLLQAVPVSNGPFGR